MNGFNNPDAISPIADQERIAIIDGLRGIALCGILMMNIPAFGLPSAAYSDPSIYNESGLKYSVWYFIKWFLEGSQRALFSILFGAGVVVFTTRLERKVSSLLPA